MARPPQQRQQQQGSPGPRQFIIMDNLPKMNTRPMRQNLSEKEAYWIENLQPIAGNDLKVVPAPLLPSLATVPGKTVARMFPTTLLDNPADPNSALVDLVIFFATDGSATAITADTGVTNEFAPPATFSNTPDMTTFSNTQILIADPLAGYCTWDGFTLTTGISGPGGPIKCTTVAVFAGRAWLAFRRLLTWSATTGPTDFTTANASGDTTITDADLVHEITALRADNNYLYIFGDQSVKFIGSVTVSTSGLVSTTEFSIVTLASDIGCPFPMSILSYNKLVVFANLHGVYAIIGASVQKVSDDLDGIFTRINFAQELCAAIADINNIHCYLLLIRYQDPFNAAVFGAQPQGTFLERSLICVLQSREWWVANQGQQLISIVSLALAETNEVVTFGSSGSDLTQLFANDNADVTFILKTALSAHGNIIVNKQMIRAGVALTASLPQSMSFLAESENGSNHYTLEAARPIIWRRPPGMIITWHNNTPAPVVFITGPGFAIPYRSAEAYGHVLGGTVFSTTNNMAINAVMFEYIDADLWSEGPGDFAFGF